MCIVLVGQRQILFLGAWEAQVQCPVLHRCSVQCCQQPVRIYDRLKSAAGHASLNAYGPKCPVTACFSSVFMDLDRLRAAGLDAAPVILRGPKMPEFDADQPNFCM